MGFADMLPKREGWMIRSRGGALFQHVDDDGQIWMAGSWRNAAIYRSEPDAQAVADELAVTHGGHWDVEQVR